MRLGGFEGLFSDMPPKRDCATTPPTVVGPNQPTPGAQPATEPRPGLTGPPTRAATDPGSPTRGRSIPGRQRRRLGPGPIRSSP